MPKNITLTAETSNDFVELFDKLCEDVLMSPPLIVRRQLLNFRGTDKAVMANAIRIEDIYKIVKQRKLEFSFKVSYTTAVYVAQVEPAVEPILDTEDVQSRMEKQREQIPESLWPEEKPIEKPKLHVPSGGDIPEFLD